MKNAKGGDFHAIECDLTNEQQVNDAFQWIKKNFKTVHILINNAGCIKYGKIESLYYAHNIINTRIDYLPVVNKCINDQD